MVSYKMHAGSEAENIFTACVFEWNTFVYCKHSAGKGGPFCILLNWQSKQLISG